MQILFCRSRVGLRVWLMHISRDKIEALAAIGLVMPGCGGGQGIPVFRHE